MPGPRRYRVKSEAGAIDLQIAPGGGGDTVRYRLDGSERNAVYAFAGGALHLKVGSLDLSVRETLYEPRAPAEVAGAGTEVRAPMNGKVVAVLVAEGESIEKGQRLVIVEAMKMQHELLAGASGTVARLSVRAGDQVATRQLLVELSLAG